MTKMHRHDRNLPQRRRKIIKRFIKNKDLSEIKSRYLEIQINRIIDSVQGLLSGIAGCKASIFVEFDGDAKS